jgi:hypothetical protein
MHKQDVVHGVYLFTGLDHWTGLLDWTTGLTFDPKILTKNGRFALVGGPRMPSLLSYPFSGREDIKCMLDQAFM